MIPFNLQRADALWLKFEGNDDPLEATGPGLDSFLAAIEAHAGELMPVYAIGKRRRKYSRAAVLKGFKEAGDRLREVILYHPGPPEASLTIILWEKPSLGQFYVNLAVLPFSFFQEPGMAAERSQRMVDLCRAWASCYNLTLCWVHSHADALLLPHSKADYYSTEALHATPREFIPAVYWLNVFGRELVDALGRERVLSTPAHHLEELPNGAVLFLTRPTVADLTSEEARQAQARALVHLRPELDFDTVLRGLRENSARLAPVEPRFPSDVAPFWMHVLDHGSISDRQQRIAGFNRRPLPEPEEWLPASSAPASDVADPRAAIDEYLNLAEGAVVLLHTQVPSVFDRTLGALTDMEVWCWREDVPGRYKPEGVEMLRVAAGAYLADVMVNELGGTWVPRRNLEEVQVRLGERAWLPFLRARRWLQSRESMLDYSLTQFSRAAARLLEPGPGR